jgi:hypothetical protein
MILVWPDYQKMAQKRATSSVFKQVTTILTRAEYANLHDAVKATHVLLTYNAAQNARGYNEQINQALKKSTPVEQLEALKGVVQNYPSSGKGKVICASGQKAMGRWIDMAIAEVKQEQQQQQQQQQEQPQEQQSR